jgi:glutamine synthetase
VNSYKRLAPGYEAPVYVSWAKTNRSALIRVPAFKKEKPKAARIELRCPDPTCNIYLAFAVMLKAGLDGIKNNLQPPESIEDDLYGFDESKLSKFNVTQLPYSLFDAVKYMKKSDLVRDVFGEATYSKYVSAKIAEWDEFRLQVTQWELDRYLELY